jgi:hypothetical protein
MFRPLRKRCGDQATSEEIKQKLRQTQAWRVLKRELTDHK